MALQMTGLMALPKTGLMALQMTGLMGPQKMDSTEPRTTHWKLQMMDSMKPRNHPMARRGSNRRTDSAVPQNYSVGAPH